LSARDAVEGSTNNILWYELVGLREGHVMVEARNPGDGAVWDYFQLAVKKQSVKLRPPVRGISYDYHGDTKGIGPDWNGSMILTLRIALVPVNGTGSPPTIKDFNGRTFLTRPWTDAAWNSWVGKFEALIVNRWSEKFWLASPAALTELQVTSKATGTRYRV